jgi:hypothetical protein
VTKGDQRRRKSGKRDKSKTPAKKPLRELDLATDTDNSHVRVRMVRDAGIAQIQSFVGRLHAREPHRYENKDRHQKRAKSRSIRTLQEIARSARLDSLLTLTFREETDIKTAKKHWQQAIRSRKVKPVGPYIVVPENGGENGRLHLHVLVRRHGATRIAGFWRHGHFALNDLDFEDLDTMCAYLGKFFAETDRPAGRRYWASRGIKPPIDTIFARSEEDAMQRITEVAGDKDAEVRHDIISAFGRFIDLRWEPGEQ